MNPFRISKKEYPDCLTVEQVINLDDVTQMEKSMYHSQPKDHPQITFIPRGLTNEDVIRAVFDDAAARDKCFDDMYQSMVESKTKVRTEYIPA